MKEKKYRNKAERVANASKMKRGGNIELLRPITDCNAADLGIAEDFSRLNPEALFGLTLGDLFTRLKIKDLYYVVADEGEAMRDVDDVEAVMTEKNIIGNCIAYRRVAEKQRAIQQVCGFVTPRQVIGQHGEEAAPKFDPADEEPPVFDEEPSPADEVVPEEENPFDSEPEGSIG